MPIVHQNMDQYRVRSAIEIIQFFINLGVITASTVQADNTVADFRTRIKNAAVHQEYVIEKRACIEAINEMEDYGVITDALLNPLTTTAGLIALMTPYNPDDDSNTARFTGSNTYTGNAITPELL